LPAAIGTVGIERRNQKFAEVRLVADDEVRNLGEGTCNEDAYSANLPTPFGSAVTSVLWPGEIERKTRRPLVVAASTERLSWSICCTVFGSVGS
jgi:hypothetical protein